MTRHAGLAVPLLLVASLAQARGPLEPLAAAVVRVRLTQLFVDADGTIHPLAEPFLGDVAVEFQQDGRGGAWYGSIVLGRDGTSSLQYKITYWPTARGHHRVTVERSLERRGETTHLPLLDHDLDPLTSWAPTLVEDRERGGRVVLVVSPEVQQASYDVDLESSRIELWLRRGLLIEKAHPMPPSAFPFVPAPIAQFFLPRIPERVVMLNLNAWGVGVRVSLPAIGVAMVATRPFEGARPCGWIRGHTMSFDLDGHSFLAMSDSLILPEDPRRPDRGWTLYGRLDPDPTITVSSFGPISGEELP